MRKKGEYIRQLEEVISKFMSPLDDIPFPVAIKAISGHEVVAFHGREARDRELLEKLSRAAELAGNAAYGEGIEARRPNEVGNYIEPYVKTGLNEVGLTAETPVTILGKRQSTGYPDIEITDNFDRTTYLECKTYNLENIDTTQRAFYFSPSKKACKITKDARHLVLSFQIETASREGRRVYTPVHWRVYDTFTMHVQVKHEFNASNRQIYREDSLLAEGEIGE